MARWILKKVGHFRKYGALVNFQYMTPVVYQHLNKCGLCSYLDNPPPPPIPPTTAPWTTPPCIFPPRTIALQGNSPRDNYPLDNSPLKANCPRPGLSPPGQYSPRQLPPANFLWTVAPRTIVPPPGESPPSNLKFLLLLLWDEVIVGFQRQTLGSLPRPSSTAHLFFVQRVIDMLNSCK